MPIKPELRHFYTGSVWAAIRRRILDRAKNKCERCRKPNHRTVLQRIQPGRMWWKTAKATLWRGRDGKLRHEPFRYVYQSQVRVVLTIAHLNQISGDDRDENLQALCQWCHLQHDREQHVRSARVTRSQRKDAARPLLQEASA